MAQVLAPNMPINGSQSVPNAQVEFSYELDLAPKNLMAPIYRLHRLTQVSGGTSVSLQNTGQTQTIFNIPGQPVYNLSKCFLEFDINVIADTKTNVPCIWADQVPCESVILQTNTGTQLALLQNLAPYTKTVRPAMTPYENYICGEPAVGGANLAATDYTTNIFMQPGVNQPAVTIQTKLSEICTGYPLCTNAGAATTFAASPVATNLILESGVDKAFQAPQRIVVGAVVAADPPVAANVNVFHCKIPFSAFKGSILAMNKSLYFGQNLQLIINWSGLNKWGFSFVPANDAPAFQNINLVEPAMRNLYLWTCTDSNLATQAMIKEEVNTNGISVMIPWTQCTSITGPAAAGSFRYSTILTPGSGLCLKRVVTVPVNSTDTAQLTSNNDNYITGGANIKWSDVQSFLNAVPLIDLPLNDINNNVWAYMQEILRGSAAGLSNRMYRLNAFWVDNFSDCKRSRDWDYEDCKFSGLNLGSDAQVYDTQFTQTCTASLKYYQYQTFLRKLYIRPNGISY